MIDSATGYKPAPVPKKRNPATDEQKKIAYAAGDELIWYIDRMFPVMWEGVPKSARTSIKNTVYNRVISILTDPDNICELDAKNAKLREALKWAEPYVPKRADCETRRMIESLLPNVQADS